MGKVTLRCPNCQRSFSVTRPDSEHNSWSFEKPQDKETPTHVVEQSFTCKNPNCNAQFTVYWYETPNVLG